MEARTVKEFGALLREARTARGETQRAIAKRIHVTQSMISKVEKGAPGASLGLIFQMLRALDLVAAVRTPAKERRPAPDDPDFVDLDAIANTGLASKRANPKSRRSVSSIQPRLKVQ